MSDIPERETTEIDRVEAFKLLVGENPPKLGETLPGDPLRSAIIARQIGRLHVAERARPVCGVVGIWRAWPDRDAGDECPCGEC